MTGRAAAGRGGCNRLAGAWRNGPLAVRDFKLLSLGQLTSTIGDYCYAVALPWLILSSHGGTILLGTVLACYGVPRTVLIPVGGILADKFGPRVMMLIADVSRCVLVAVLAVLAVLAARHANSLALLGPVAALLGAGEGCFLPASLSIMPTILPSAKLPSGNSLSTAMVQVGSLAGPVLGGLLVTTAGPAIAFGVDAASFAISAASLALISARRAAAPPGDRTAATKPAGQAATAAGGGGGGQSLRTLLRQSRFLQIILLIAVVANLTSGGTFEVAMPALAHANFGAAGYGALVACFGGGAVAGTLAASKSGALRRPARAAFYVFFVEAVGISLLPFLGGLPGAAAAFLLVGVSNGFGNIVIITLLQQWAPAALLGRVMSLIMLAAIGTFPASVALAGVLVKHLGPTPFFPVAGAFLIVTILAALTQRELRDFGAVRPDQAEPETAIAAG